jgi:hypothetical protein
VSQLCLGGGDSIMKVHQDRTTRGLFLSLNALISRLCLACLTAALLISTATAPCVSWAAEDSEYAEIRALARINVSSGIEKLGVPVNAHNMDSSGQVYILTIETASRLASLKLPFEIIDHDVSGRDYFIARERRSGARQQAAAELRVLHDDGKRIIVHKKPGYDRLLASMGFDLRLLRKTPVTLSQPTLKAAAKAITPDPVVQEMINRVNQDDLYAYVAGLSGVTSVTVGGSPYTILTRNTESGTPIRKTTQYVYEYLENLGITVSYQDWSDDGYSGRNIIGELTGSVLPDEIVLITAHLDDMPETGIAPGADDNGSGSAAVMLAANIMSGYSFDRTVRFVLFTGEEQGLYGSYAYATSVSGENIVGVFNMDMISYNKNFPTYLSLHIRPGSNPGYAADLAIATAFIDVVNAYGLPLEPVVAADGDDASDHYSFWEKGFAALLAIEYDSDFNPNYHTTDDTLDAFNMPYFTAFTKASIGTTAHLAGNPVATCANLPVRILNATPSYYMQIQTAYGAATTGLTIQAMEQTFGENLIFAGNKIIALIGGYDCAYEEISDFSVINGSMTIRAGTVTVANLIIK